MKQKKFSIMLAADDALDVTINFENHQIIEFALNYRAWIGEQWHEIYRVDNYHGFLHENRMWQDRKAIPITDKEGWTMPMIIDYYIDEITANFPRYKRLFEETLLPQNS